MSKYLYRATLAGLAALLIGGVPTLKAQTTTPTATQSPDNDTTRGELRNFDTFLDNHPEVAEDIRKNPSLVNDPNYLQQHPGLKEYIENHPRVAEELKENPSQFMKREGRLDRREGRGENDTTRTEVRNFDGFLDKHPEVAEDLRKNPGLVNDPNYVNNHPQLKEFLANHPGVREEIRENPKAFMKREKKFDKHEGETNDERAERRARRARRRR